MDLKAKKKTLVGQRLGVEGEIYDQWEGDVLKNVPDHHAKQLLEAKEFWGLARTVPSRAQAAPAAPPQPAPEPEPTPEPEPVSEPQEASQSDGDSEGDDDSYSEADLMAMPKAELLEFLDETQHEDAAKLKKAELVKLILEGAD